MFKDLLEFYHTNDKDMDDKCKEFFSELKNFPFYSDLKKILSNAKYNINELLEDKNYKLILEYLLFEKGKLPKALLKFSQYVNNIRTALEEHFYEGIEYASDLNNNVKLHFTVSEEHLDGFEGLTDELKSKFLPGYTFDVTFSTQKPSTDTIAVDENNVPLRDENDNVVLRPGGHGALIHNLNSLNENIVFIKNVDNVITDQNKTITIEHKKIIGGILIKTQNAIFKYIEDLNSRKYSDIITIEKYIKNDLNLTLPSNYYENIIEKKAKILLSTLNRPIRVCGMVKNTGAPGGGPFFVKKNDTISLQIVESSQIDLSKEDQREIFESSTHFNPVDLVCGLKDHNGNNFNLLDFIDHDAYFISNKSLNGKPLKALELPGLWNGAMANWITLFIDVPLETFNPVKTVNDLLLNF
ncbi:MAG: DUF4301 family protein, partial [Candidatus Delongbacteria bacterium]|nr:DUF4301 family protein [Candidatus Delongbacteria bacterium]